MYILDSVVLVGAKKYSYGGVMYLKDTPTKVTPAIAEYLTSITKENDTFYFVALRPQVAEQEAIPEKPTRRRVGQPPKQPSRQEVNLEPSGKDVMDDINSADITVT